MEKIKFNSNHRKSGKKEFTISPDALEHYKKEFILNGGTVTKLDAQISPALNHVNSNSYSGADRLSEMKIITL